MSEITYRKATLYLNLNPTATVSLTQHNVGTVTPVLADDGEIPDDTEEVLLNEDVEMQPDVRSSCAINPKLQSRENRSESQAWKSGQQRFFG